MYLHLLLSPFVSVCLDKENLKLIAFIHLSSLVRHFLQFRADSHIQKLPFPSSLLALIMHSYLEIECQTTNFLATAARFAPKDSLEHNVSKQSLSQKSLYVSRKDRQCKFIFLLSPGLDLINIISSAYLDC